MAKKLPDQSDSVSDGAPQALVIHHSIQERWTTLEEWRLRDVETGRVSPHALVLYHRLQSHGSVGDLVYPGNASLAKAQGCDERTIRRRLHEIVEAGWAIRGSSPDGWVAPRSKGSGPWRVLWLPPTRALAPDGREPALEFFAGGEVRVVARRVRSGDGPDAGRPGGADVPRPGGADARRPPESSSSDPDAEEEEEEEVQVPERPAEPLRPSGAPSAGLRPALLPSLSGEEEARRDAQWERVADLLALPGLNERERGQAAAYLKRLRTRALTEAEARWVEDAHREVPTRAETASGSSRASGSGREADAEIQSARATALWDQLGSLTKKWQADEAAHAAVVHAERLERASGILDPDDPLESGAGVGSSEVAAERREEAEARAAAEREARMAKAREEHEVKARLLEELRSSEAARKARRAEKEGAA